MTSTGILRSRLGRRALLAGVVAVHLLALFCWPGRVPLAGTAVSTIDIVFVAPPREPAQASPAPRTPDRPAVPRVQRRTPPLVIIAPPVSPAVATSDLPPPQSVAETPALVSADTLRQTALASAGRIDRDLRKQSLNMNERTLSMQPDRLAHGIASALVQRGPAKVEEMVMADGRRISRIGNKCAYMESNALTRGRDVIQNGVRTIWANCDYAR